MNHKELRMYGKQLLNADEARAWEGYVAGLNIRSGGSYADIRKCVL